VVKESGEEPVSRSLYLILALCSFFQPKSPRQQQHLGASESPKVDLTTLQTANDCAFTTRCVSTRVV